MRVAAMFVLAALATPAQSLTVCSVECPGDCTPVYKNYPDPVNRWVLCDGAGDTWQSHMGFGRMCSLNVQPTTVAPETSEVCEVTSEGYMAEGLCKKAGRCDLVKYLERRQARTCDCGAGLPALAFGARTECTATFNGVIKSLVAAYEQLGHLDSHYDETGRCGEGCTVWGRSTTNPTLTLTLTSFKNMEGPGVSGPCVGEYSGFADFYSVRNGVDEKYRRVTATFIWSGEDITAQVSVTSPPLLTQIDYGPTMWGIKAHAVNCPSSKNQRACSNWSLFGYLLRTIDGQTTLETKEPTIEEVVKLLREETRGQGGSAARIEEEIRVLEEYYTAHSSEITLKTLRYEEPAWDAVEITTFIYNQRTRKLLSVWKPLWST
eukprot:TRINITY_DN3838_c0_g2_i1.p1 TRINITY_DN3838_c0_g2~~TRINITY_DN3838_c0_g2_i1.p1  ORF type:complete len:377 (+),score=109.79 TRINITY_DN3838_c0_g2_i1:50-1180(+)